MTTAVLYDHNFDLTYTIEGPDVLDTRAGAVTISVDHPAVKWLLAQTECKASVFAAIQTSGGQWRGRLTEWSIHTRGTCSKCAHCQQKAMTTKWAIPPR